MAVPLDNEKRIFNAMDITANEKGIIGEQLFAATRRRLFLTSIFAKELLLSKIKPGLSPEQYDFLDKYWYSIDGLEFVNYVPHLFEIKSRQSKYANFKPRITLTAAKIYPEAKKLGFVCKLAQIYFLNNWQYSVQCTDFAIDACDIDRPTRFDSYRFELAKR